MDLAKTLQRAASDLAAKAADMADDVLPDNEPVGKVPTPVTRKVCVITYNPQIKEGAKAIKLSELMKWNNPDDLIPKYIADLKPCSHGYANFEVVERHEVNKVPAKVDGFIYKPEEFVQCLRAGKGFHDPDAVDYHAILKDFDIINKVNSGKIDEVWLFAFPMRVSTSRLWRGRAPSGATPPRWKRPRPPNGALSSWATITSAAWAK
jgi:hypothetical protein